MHRFYIFHPIDLFPNEIIAAAAFALGAKSENQQRPFEQIIKALIKVMNREVAPESFVESFNNEIVEVEALMMMTFGYDLSVQLQSKYIREACQLFNITNSE